MCTFYVDETGFTGEDLLAKDQPIFVQATNNFTLEETTEIIRQVFSGVNAEELKHSRLIRNSNHHRRIFELIQIIAGQPERAGTWVAHKEFALLALIVDWWIEPLAYRGGINLYKDGANLGMANMLFTTLEGFWSSKFRRDLLMGFQRTFRTRNPQIFNECARRIAKEAEKVDAERRQILNYFLQSFYHLGFRHVRSLPNRVLDVALPGLIYIGHKWRSKQDGPWRLVHDQSSNMAKQRWIWDALSSPDLPSAQFAHPGGMATYPMNVMSTQFKNSAYEKQLQICDILAGATSAWIRHFRSSGAERKYSEGLESAGIGSLVWGSIWPSPEVTPEALGTKGWDGSHAIEWVGEKIHAYRKGRE